MDCSIGFSRSLALAFSIGGVRVRLQPCCRLPPSSLPPMSAICAYFKWKNFTAHLLFLAGAVKPQLVFTPFVPPSSFVTSPLPILKQIKDK